MMERFGWIIKTFLVTLIVSMYAESKTGRRLESKGNLFVFRILMTPILR